MPRTRERRLARPRAIIDRRHVGDDSMPETCPRCGWPCTHLVSAYWDSPWNEHGGMCSQCCRDANLVFERDGWPPEEVDEPSEQTVQGELWNRDDD